LKGKKGERTDNGVVNERGWTGGKSNCSTLAPQSTSDRGGGAFRRKNGSFRKKKKENSGREKGDRKGDYSKSKRG